MQGVYVQYTPAVFFEVRLHRGTNVYIFVRQILPLHVYSRVRGAKMNICACSDYSCNPIRL